MAEPLRTPHHRAAVDPDVAADLLARFAAGDEHALQESYEQCSSVVFTVIRAAAGTRRADDLTQQVFVAAWQDRAAFRQGAGPLPALLLGVTLQVLSAGRSSGDTDAADIAERVLLADELRQLEDPRQRIMELILDQGLHHAEAANLLSLPETTVRREVSASLAQLADRLAIDLPAAGSPVAAPPAAAGPHVPEATMALRALGEEVGLPHESALDDSHLTACPRCAADLAARVVIVVAARTVTAADALAPAPPAVWAGITDQLHLWPEPVVVPDDVSAPKSIWRRRRR